MSSGGSAELYGTLLIVGLVVLVGVAVKLYDRRRKRQDEAIQLQAQVSDALLRDPRLVNVPIVVTAHVPTFGHGPAVLDVSGQVPTRDLHDVALRVVDQEASRIRPDVMLENRLAVVPLARVA